MVATSAFAGGCILLYVVCSIAAAGGVGGGGINVPVLLLVFNYSFERAVVFSLCIVLGNALAQCALNINRRHPSDVKKPLIFWELVVILLPAQMGGSNFGNLLGDVFPVSFKYIIALLTLSYAVYVSLLKGLHKWHAENKVMLTDETSSSRIDDSNKESAKELNRSLKSELNAPLLASKSRKEPMTWPKKVLGVIAAMWIVYNCLSVAQVEVDGCSAEYVAIFFILYIPLLAAIVWGVRYNVQMNETSCSAIADDSRLEIGVSSGVAAVSPAQSNGGHDEQEFRVDRSNGWFLSTFAFAVGILCSVLGIGGGELFGPIMLAYGVIPQVSSATTSMMSFLNTLGLIIRNMVLAKIHYGTAAIFFLVGFMGGFSGRKLGLLISQHGRPSAIILALTSVLLLSTLYYVYELAAEKFEYHSEPYC